MVHIGIGKAHNDYGRGFYCTELIELAKEWACTERKNGYANKYEIENDGPSILNLLLDVYDYKLACYIDDESQRKIAFTYC